MHGRSKEREGEAALRKNEPSRGAEQYQPRVDVAELGDEVLLFADVPGAAASGIEVEFEDGELAVRVPVAPREFESSNWLVKEYGVGDFTRRFRVGEGIDSSRIRAEYAHGVLTIHLPKIDAVKPRRIPVSAN
jgi:HSP20 family protein